MLWLVWVHRGGRVWFEVISDLLQRCLSTFFLSLGVCEEGLCVCYLCGRLGVVCWVFSMVCILSVSGIGSCLGVG